MIYIYYIIYKHYVITSVLAVGDDDDMLSEAAKAIGTCGSAQKLMWMALGN